VAEAGKGSRQRPVENQDQFNENWARIFGGVSSPCVEICELDYTAGYCRGCHRTLGEIAAWGSCDDEGKKQILKDVEERKKRA
jgi:uncharacterized protein